jgi:hypothetical protein
LFLLRKLDFPFGKISKCALENELIYFLENQTRSSWLVADVCLY